LLAVPHFNEDLLFWHTEFLADFVQLEQQLLRGRNNKGFVAEVPTLFEE
jgi:hypothetical protein